MKAKQLNWHDVSESQGKFVGHVLLKAFPPHWLTESNSYFSITNGYSKETKFDDGFYVVFPDDVFLYEHQVETLEEGKEMCQEKYDDLISDFYIEFLKEVIL
jgi:hypothetical protein